MTLAVNVAVCCLQILLRVQRVIPEVSIFRYRLSPETFGYTLLLHPVYLYVSIVGPRRSLLGIEMVLNSMKIPIRTPVMLMSELELRLVIPVRVYGHLA